MCYIILILASKKTVFYSVNVLGFASILCQLIALLNAGSDNPGGTELSPLDSVKLNAKILYQEKL